MTRTRTPSGALLLSAVLSLGGLVAAPSASALTTQPILHLDRTITTSPFTGTTTSLRDNEGLAYVPRDGSLWIASDNDKAIFEINPTTGALKRKLAQASFANAPEVGTGALATTSRNGDIEGAAYDSTRDVLYVFSGSTSSTPTAYQLTRDGAGAFQVTSWQPLPSGADWTAVAFRPSDGKLYVGSRSTFATYDYATNTFGSTFSVSGVSGVYGMDFTDDGADLLVATGAQTLQRVDMSTRSLLPGWTLDLSPFGMLDSRAVEMVGDRFFVSDGYDFRAAGDPLAHAVFVFSVTDGAGTPAPTAAFTASPSSGTAPLTVQFTDTSAGSPTSWSWDFGDGGTSTSRNPSHTFAAGTFSVTLRATNDGGSTSAARTISVSAAATRPTAAFTASPSSGTAPLTVQFTDTSTGSPTSWSWSFGDGETSTSRNPSHIYTSGATFTATLTATNAAGSSSVSKAITVSTPTDTTATFRPDADAYVNTSSPKKNYGAATVLKLHSPVTAEYRPLVRFVVTGLTGAPSSVKLRLWVTDASTAGGTWYKVSNSWTESTVTWNTRPTVDGAPVAGTAGAATAGTWLEVDVTSTVTGNGTYSFEATSPSTNTAKFSSREGTTAPQLVVTR